MKTSKDTQFPATIDLGLVSHTEGSDEALFMKRGHPTLVSSAGKSKRLSWSAACEWLKENESYQEIGRLAGTHNYKALIEFYTKLSAALRKVGR